LRGKEKAVSPEHTETLAAINNLGDLYRSQGKLTEAEEMLKRALDGHEKALGPEHTETLGTINSLASLYLDQGKLEEPEEMFQRILQGYEKERGPEHPVTKIIAENLRLVREEKARRGKWFTWRVLRR